MKATNSILVARANLRSHRSKLVTGGFWRWLLRHRGCQRINRRYVVAHRLAKFGTLGNSTLIPSYAIIPFPRQSDTGQRGTSAYARAGYLSQFHVCMFPVMFGAIRPSWQS